MRVLLSFGLVAALVSSTAAGGGDAGPVRPVEVTPADADADVLSIAPALLVVEADPGVRHEAVLVVTNASSRALDLGLRVASVHEEGQATDVDDAVAAWTTLPADAVHLDPGERAEVRPVISVPADAGDRSHVAAVVAAADGGPAVEATLVVAIGEPRPEIAPEISLTPVSPGRIRLTATLTNRGAGHALVAGRLRVSWAGRLLDDVVVPETLVLPAATRSLGWEVAAPRLPGPVTASLDLGTDGVASVRLWRWPDAPVWAAVVTLMLAMTVLVVTRRRRGAYVLEPPTAGRDEEST